MTTLTDTQMTMLSTASQRQDGGLLPLPVGMKPSGGIHRSLAMLLANGLVEERDTDDGKPAFRVEGDRRTALFISSSGADAVASRRSEAASSPAAGEPKEEAPGTGVNAGSCKRPTKAATVLALLNRSEGATITELMTATGWLAHTVRAALSELRKKDYALVRSKREGVTCYSIR